MIQTIRLEELNKENRPYMAYVRNGIMFIVLNDLVWKFYTRDKNRPIDEWLVNIISNLSLYEAIRKLEGNEISWKLGSMAIDLIVDWNSHPDWVKELADVLL